MCVGCCEYVYELSGCVDICSKTTNLHTGLFKFFVHIYTQLYLRISKCYTVSFTHFPHSLLLLPKGIN